MVLVFVECDEARAFNAPAQTLPAEMRYMFKQGRVPWHGARATRRLGGWPP